MPAAPKKIAPKADSAKQEVELKLPADQPVVVLGLNGPNPYMRMPVPMSIIQLALLSSYLNAVVQDEWIRVMKEQGAQSATDAANQAPAPKKGKKA